MMNNPSSISRRLDRADPRFFSAYCIVAAFGTYFCMYAFRKPFTAGTFDDATLWGAGYKTILVASQVAGYTLSKFLGVKFVSEMPASRRAVSILGLIAAAEIALLLFAVTPPPWNWVWLFFNGLPLGMVFGLVLAFLEGRQVTEALAAGLCASFIVSSGVVKSVGRWLILECGVSEYWMPAMTGALFLAPLLAFVWMLNQIPQPSAEDVALRSSRKPMDGRERRGFFRRHALGLCGMLTIYILLTVMRSIRDDFAVEIWSDLGEGDEPAIFAWAELFVMFGVVIVNGAAIWTKDNRRAFLGSLGLLALGMGIVLTSLAGHWQGWLAPFEFMVLLGLGMYIPYVAFHTTIFERMIAVFRETGNIGYLMYLADAVGYLGYIGVMAARHRFTTDAPFLPLMTRTSLWIAASSLGVILLLTVYYYRRLPRT